MSTRALESVFLWGTKIFLWLIPFVSLIISSSTLFPYIVGKNIAFRVLVELAFVLWVGLAVLKKEYRPRFSPLAMAGLAFLAVVALADIFGVNPFRSFWSNYERMEGLMGIIHAVVFFFLLSSVFLKKQDWTAFFNAFVAAGIINGIYGLLQKLGAIRSIQGGFRIDGTIGNPTYFAAYLMLILVALGILWWQAKHKWLQWTYGVIAAFFLLLIYFAASRGVTVGIGAGVILFCIGYLIWGRKESLSRLGSRIAAGLLIAAVVIPAGLYALKNTGFVKSSEVLSRMTSISFDETTTRARFMIWGMALQAWKERPLLGWGQENFIEPFVRYYNPGLADQEPWFDRAHNVFLDWLVNAGALGLLAYLSLFAAAGIMLVRAIKKRACGARLGVFLAAGLAAYFIQNLFVFDNLNTYILFFSLLAYLNAAGSAGEESAAAKKEEEPSESAFTYSIIAGTLAALLVALVMYAGNYKPWRQAQMIIQFLSVRLSPETVPAGIAYAKKMIAADTLGITEAREQLGQRAMEFSDTTFVAYAVEELEQHLIRFPNDPRMRVFLGTLYTRAAALDPSYALRGKEHLMRALQQGPNRQINHLSLAENYLAAQDYAQALEAARKAVALAPQFPEPRAALVQIAFFMNRFDIVDEVLKENRDPQILLRIGDLYMRFSKPHLALPFYQEILEMRPRWTAVWSRAADTLASLQRYDEAIAAARRYGELEPSEKERVDAFIATMEQQKRGVK